ncbi:elongation factor P--(R)-beta-lysine ligase [Buchnera aphidicola (Aphis helianthi)]|uniref:Elongation factor P--(R)-beta-lysine ligase n=1 Tax=Buchnera aphidicola (Aphis helianthi) TaxID=2315802 RepID=A0A4D6XKH4_9GAMM|nr:elongation factor P--(R)-beta-lysine ligase [Buchnera aphidicola]QCI17376.1 elongation factor P--(R)-beta-lysine ligase [Buchnera aphidicola (Aphis helianthi)]
MQQSWRPSASIKDLIKRAEIIANIRLFFLEKKILEVETPFLSKSTVTDINLTPFETNYFSSESNLNALKLWLITSPEYHMKRLLAAKSGPIYQICHSFRNKEYGKYHNPEFTMLEWYQISYSMKKFINQIDFFFQKILKCEKSDKISYQKIFIKHLNIDPFSTNLSELYKISKKFDLEHLTYSENNLNTLIEILFTLIIEPILGKKRPIFIYHFPVEQASLAALNNKDNRIAERFEIFFKGIELGNGFYELTDYSENKKRLINNNKIRYKMNLPIQKIDNNFLNAIHHGLPSSSGVAIGIDRLIMIALEKKNINEVLSFAFDRC